MVRRPKLVYASPAVVELFQDLPGQGRREGRLPVSTFNGRPQGFKVIGQRDGIGRQPDRVLFQHDLSPFLEIPEGPVEELGIHGGSDADSQLLLGTAFFSGWFL